MDRDLPVLNFVITDDDNDDTGVEYVALVNNPATQRNWIAFNNQEPVKFEIQDKEQRIVSGPLMVANLPIYRNDPKIGEFYCVFTPDVIKKIVFKYFRKGFHKNVNIMHDSNMIADGVYLFESFLIDSKRGIKAPEGFSGLTEGSWFGSFKVDNERVWEEISNGTWKGFSVEGFFDAGKKYTQKESSIESIIDKLQSIFRTEVDNGYLKDKGTNHMEKTKSKFNTLLTELKDKLTSFNDEVENPETPETFKDYKLEDGSIARVEGELIPGSKVSIVVEDGSLVDAPNGEHKLKDGSIIVVEGALIIEVKEAVPTEKEVDPADEEKMAEMKKQLDAVFAKVEATEKRMNELNTAFNEAVKINSSNTALIAKQKEVLNQMFAVVEQIADTPNDEPATKPFAFKKNENKMESAIEAMKQIKLKK